MIVCFIGGVLVGGFIGVALMCLLSVAGDSEDIRKEGDKLDQNEDHTKSL